MAAREKMKLTEAAIARLRPREREYTVWDKAYDRVCAGLPNGTVSQMGPASRNVATAWMRYRGRGAGKRRSSEPDKS